MRRVAVVPLLIAFAITPARAQSPSGSGSAFLIGYGALSLGAIVNLINRDAPPTIETGTHLKVRLRGFTDWSKPVRVVRLDRDSLWVAGDSADQHFARSEIDSLRIKVSTGRWAEGWGIGLLAGGAVGAALGYTSSSSHDGGDDWFTPGEGAVIGGIVFGVGGSIVGAGIGLGAASRWVTVGAPTTESRFSITPTIGRRGFVAQFRF